MADLSLSAASTQFVGISKLIVEADYGGIQLSNCLVEAGHLWVRHRCRSGAPLGHLAALGKPGRRRSLVCMCLHAL